jgi:hypothetical protein
MACSLGLSLLFGYDGNCSNLENLYAGKFLNSRVTPILLQRTWDDRFVDYGVSSLTLLVGAIVVSDMSLVFILANYGSFPDVRPHMKRAPHPLYTVRFVVKETGNQ